MELGVFCYTAIAKKYILPSTSSHLLLSVMLIHLYGGEVSTSSQPLLGTMSLRNFLLIDTFYTYIHIHTIT